MIRRLFLVSLVMLASLLYIIPLLIIMVLAYLCNFMGINEDLTSTKPVVWFITPLTYLEEKLKHGKRKSFKS